MRSLIQSFRVKEVGGEGEEGMDVGQVPLSLSFQTPSKETKCQVWTTFSVDEVPFVFSLIVVHTNGCMCFLHEIGFFRVYFDSRHQHFFITTQPASHLD